LHPIQGLCVRLAAHRARTEIQLCQNILVGAFPIKTPPGGMFVQQENGSKTPYKYQYGKNAEKDSWFAHRYNSLGLQNLLERFKMSVWY
jgi:hypothetical protein